MLRFPPHGCQVLGCWQDLQGVGGLLCMGSPYLSLQQTSKRFLCLVVVLTFHFSTKACVVLVPAFHFSKQAGAFYVLTLCVMPGD